MDSENLVPLSIRHRLAHGTSQPTPRIPIVGRVDSGPVERRSCSPPTLTIAVLGREKVQKETEGKSENWPEAMPPPSVLQALPQ